MHDSRLKGLKHLKKLEVFDLIRTSLNSIECIEEPINLWELNLYGTKIISIVNNLDALPRLKSVNLLGRFGYIPFEEFKYLIEKKGKNIISYGRPSLEP